MLAWPATFEFGAFASPTEATKAASNCNSPSILSAKSGASFLAIAVASATLSTSGDFAEPLV